MHRLQRNVELDEKITLKGCVFPLPGKTEQAVVPSSATTPRLSLQSGKTGQAVSRVNTAAQQPAAPTLPAYRQPLMRSLDGAGLALQKQGAGARASPAHLTMGSRHPSHIPFSHTVTTISVERWYGAAGQFTALGPTYAGSHLALAQLTGTLGKLLSLLEPGFSSAT